MFNIQLIVYYINNYRLLLPVGTAKLKLLDSGVEEKIIRWFPFSDQETSPCVKLVVQDSSVLSPNIVKPPASVCVTKRETEKFM